MSSILPQQRLLLELILLSGDIAVPSDGNETVLAKTLEECKAHGWVTLQTFGAGFNKVHITDTGRIAAKPS